MDIDFKRKQSVLTKYHVDPDTKKPITIPVTEKQQIHPLKNLIQMVGEVKKNKKIQIIDRDMIPVNKAEKITQPYHYYVDYEQNLIHFHPDIAGQTVEYKYEDMGVTVISANKIFTKQDAKGNVVELLEDIIEYGREAIDVMTTIGGVAIIMKRLEDDIKEGYKVSDKIQADIQQAKDEILNVRGNREIIIQASQWKLNANVYEKEIIHDLNSENLHVTAKNSDTKEAVTIGYKILDKTRILLKSDEAINMSVILSASYYHATQTIADNISEEVIKARKGEVDLKTKIDSIDEQLGKITKYNRSKEINIVFPPTPLSPCDMTGKTDSTENLKAILKYASDNYKHTTIIIPDGELLITDTIDIDVEKISIECQAIIKCDLSSNKYALRFGYSGTHDGLYTKARTVYKGLYLANKNNVTKVGNGILFGGTAESVGSSNINLINCIIQDFTNGLSYGDRSYLIRCNNCDLYNNIVQINVLGGHDTGENIRFDNCVIANGGTALLANNSLATIYFNGCSIDYHYTQIFNIQKGDVYVDGCHLEHDANHFSTTTPFEMSDYDGNKVTITNSRIIFIERLNKTTMGYIIKNHYYNNAMSYFNITNCFIQGFKTTSGYIGTGFINMHGNQCYQWDDMNYKVSEEMNKINDGKFFNADLIIHKDFIKIKEPNNVEIGTKYDRTFPGDNWLMMKKKTGIGTDGSCGFVVPRNILCSNFGGEMTICSNNDANIDIRFGTCRLMEGKVIHDNLRYNVGQIQLTTSPTQHKLNNRHFTLNDNKNDYLFMEVILFNCDVGTEVYIKNMGIYEF